MKKMLFKAVLLSTVGFFVSCSKEDISMNSEIATATKIDQSKVTNLDQLKQRFAKALVKSLNDNPDFRLLIKTKALETFNNDTEVLYEMIKNEIVGGVEVNSLILSHFDNASDLDQLLTLMPDLTILVPILPENSFSAEIWNIAEVPAVAVRMDHLNEVPAYFPDGTEEIIPGNMTPSYPVLVIKNNERVIAQNNADFDKLKTRTVTSKSGVNFRFLDDTFDAVYQKPSSMRQYHTPTVDPKLLQAYGLYNGTDGWQRDHIYYNINSNNPNGPFVYDYQEHITDFRLSRDGLQSYQKICDQTDPVGVPYISNPNDLPSHWTEGSLEFRVICIINATSGAGAEVIRYIPAYPYEIFSLTFKKASPPFSNYYTATAIGTKTKQISLAFFNWDLDTYASTVKYQIEEVDLTTTTTETDTRVVKFATNFAIDPALGQKVKYGLKFGASLEITTTSSVAKTITQGSDELGDITVNFADKFILAANNSIVTTRTYDSGWFEISVEPKKVQ